MRFNKWSDCYRINLDRYDQFTWVSAAGEHFQITAIHVYSNYFRLVGYSAKGDTQVLTEVFEIGKAIIDVEHMPFAVVKKILQLTPKSPLGPPILVARSEVADA